MTSDEQLQDRAGSVIFYAFRYALGRQTYAVHDVARALIATAESLPSSTRHLIVKEIEEAIDGDRAGSDNDAEIWRSVADRMRKQERTDVPNA